MASAMEHPKPIDPPVPSEPPNANPAAERQANEAAWFNALMNHMPDAIYFKDRESRFQAVSAAMAHLFGVGGPAALTGKTDFDFFTGEHAEQAFRDEQEIARTGRPVVAKEEKETWPDGRETWVTSTKVPIVNAEGYVTGIMGISRDITEKVTAQRALAESERILREYRDQMQMELERASTIQEALLPPRMMETPQLKVCYEYHPMEKVGGDFVAVLEPNPGGTGLLFGDLTGHGVSAAPFTALVRFLSERISETFGDRPDEYLRRLNGELANRLPLAFMTALYLFAERGGDPDKLSLRLASAGHHAPLVIRAEGNLLETPAMVNAPALGLLPAIEPVQYPMTLARGDRLVLVSDGVLECRNREESEYGDGRLRKTVASLAAGTAGELAAGLVDSVRKWSPTGRGDDDITVLVCEAK